MTFYNVIGLSFDGNAWVIEYDADHDVRVATDVTPHVEMDRNGNFRVTFES